MLVAVGWFVCGVCLIAVFCALAVKRFVLCGDLFGVGFGSCLVDLLVFSCVYYEAVAGWVLFGLGWLL